MASEDMHIATSTPAPEHAVHVARCSVSSPLQPARTAHPDVETRKAATAKDKFCEARHQVGTSRFGTAWQSLWSASWLMAGEQSSRKTFSLLSDDAGKVEGTEEEE